MKTGIPIKVATHVINYEYIERLTWEEKETKDYDWDCDIYTRRIVVVSSDGVILSPTVHTLVTRHVLNRSLILNEKTMSDMSINELPSDWLILNPNKTSDYDFSGCGDYFIYECDSIHDKITLIHEAMEQGYSLLPSFSINVVEMQKKQTMKFE